MPKKAILTLLTLLVLVSLACNLTAPKASSADLAKVDFAGIAASLPTDFSPEAPLASPSAAALREAAVLDPAVAGLVERVESAELAGLRDLIGQIQKSSETGSVPALAVFDPFGSKPSGLARGFGAPYRQEADRVSDSVKAGAFIAAILTAMSDTLGAKLTDLSQQRLPKSVEMEYNASNPVTDGAAVSGLILELQPDGSSNVGMTLQVDSGKVKSSITTRVEGQRCPDVNGKVNFTTKIHVLSDTGKVVLDQDITTVVKTQVDDNAQITNTTLDITQATRKAADGKQIYVESLLSLGIQGEQLNKDSISVLKENVIRSSQQANVFDRTELHTDGRAGGFYMGMLVLRMAEENWKKGGCVALEASIPSLVPVNSQHSIPVKVIQRYERTEVNAKVNVALEGGKSINPNQLDKAPGTLTYTAPDARGQKATIRLTVKSWRGAAALELPVSTSGNAYRISGTHDGSTKTYEGLVCDTSLPFKIEGQPEFDFFPLSETGGFYTYTDQASHYSGNGTYTINEDGSMTLICMVEMIDAGKGGVLKNVTHQWKAEAVSPDACNVK